ncbi:MAG TPA: hypothetical protein VGZ27_19805 [Vicinamibacterales bacterium]|jgi:hypothetical protein|nr:hypothetical protein [Vicinamibacterales bacterium]
MKAGEMTKPTLKALFVAGGLLGTWLAVTPSDTTPGRSRIAAAERPAAIRESTADNLVSQEARLRDHAGSVPLASSKRNPFRFGSRKPDGVVPQQGSAAPVIAAAPPAPPRPDLNFLGVAESKTPQGTRRTAIISGGGQLYLVTEGEPVAGRYRVVTIDSDAVTLRDDSGTDLRLSLK